jgi:hypothetical protein
VNRLLRSTRGADRAALQPNQKITLPMTWHGVIGDFRWALADQRFRRDMSPRLCSGPRSRYSQRPASAQAADQIPFERTACFDVERLIDGLVANPHSLIIGELQRQPTGDLFGTPRRHPGAITPVRLVAALPRGAGGADDDPPVSTANHSGQLVLDVLAQPVVTDQLGRLRPAGTPSSVPLRHRGLVFQAIGACRGVAAQFTRDRRRRPGLRAISRTPAPWARHKAMSSRSFDER